ncbi:MAG: peptidylprolyl isomerase [Bacteroidota bacterium]|jgi:peptidyl-prolyl cis-trans isomerase SurA|nr:MAG: peptidylprolyl isomerase [Bacteroidota bacterium]
MKRFFRAWSLIAILTLGSIAAFGQDDPYVVDEIIAKVDNYIVLKSELDRAYLDYLANGGRQSEETRCQFLALLIRNKLMMAKAEIDSVVVLDEEVDANTQSRINMILAQSGNSAQQLEAIYGKSMEQIRLELRDQIKEQMVVREMERTISADIAVTPAEVKRFFSRIPQDSLPYFSAEVEVAQIVRKAKVNNQQKEATKRELIAIRDRILRGEDFSELAKRHSDDPSVTYNGGDMGWVGRGQMVPEYEATAFRLEKNEISQPFETEYGFHIMQLLDRRGNEYHSRHILISPEPSEEDVQDAIAFLDSIRTLIINDSLTFQKAAREFSDDVLTKGNGGFFTDSQGSMRIPVDELDPYVFLTIDSMKVGDISRPIVYRTDDGKQAARILYYKSRVGPHEASLDRDWERIQAAALNEKKNRLLQKWFEKARHDVFISIDEAYDHCGILDQ